MAQQFFSPLQLNSTLTVGADTSGHDVTFYGAATGEKMVWDTSESQLVINHDTDDYGLGIFTVSSAQMTQPQLKVGRDEGQYWGVYTADRTAYIVHRQDETSGTMNTHFEQWDSNTSDTAGNWIWRFGDGTGSSMAESMVLDQAGNLEIKGTLTMPNSQTLTASSGNITFSGDITCGDDLFMPSGGVINFNSGDVTMTHSSNQLEVNGGNFIVQSNIECNDLDIGGTATGDGSGLTELNGSNIASGTIASARLDADTAHLTTTQTFTGAKTFSAAVTVSNSTASSSKTTGAVKVTGGVGIQGALNVGADVTAFASSDRRYKDNLQAITNPIDKVKSLTGYTFTWNDKHEQFNGSDDIGVVAQEVEKIFPEIVDTRDNGYKAVKYEKMVALLIEAVKDQQKQIDELREKCNGCSC